ncbi:MAG: tetratricopeptide repeat protein [Synechococcales cyanobacterium T60_A2020_003]|nr:tetratricopeptide repeat protein [Synechococcales cyanobacterium T60_A2020_003]
MDFSIARQRFYQETRQSPNEINLARAALYIAQEEYPALDVDAYLNALDTMAAEVQDRLPSDLYPLRIIKTLNDYLYRDLGFKGNAANYYDPRNSFLNEVIDRRLGIPITLALLYLEVAQRIDFPMVGVGLPGHFLIKPTARDMTIFVDAFNAGDVLFVEDCQDKLKQLYGGAAEWRDEFLRPVDAPHFLARMLTNLKFIYLNSQDIPKALAATERILFLFPKAGSELRDRGLLYYQMQRWTEAQVDLHAYLEMAPNAPDAIAIQQLLDRIVTDL